MGESRLRRLRAQQDLEASVGLQTAGGRVSVRWDNDRAATPMGQLAFFIEFLTLTGLWKRWKDECPLSYTSPNAQQSTTYWVLGCSRFFRVIGVMPM